MTDVNPTATPTEAPGSPLTSETLGPLTAPQVEELVPSEAARRRPRHERGAEPLLKVSGLKTSFHTRDGVVGGVVGVVLVVDGGEFLGLVGVSGCGKCVTSLSLMVFVFKIC